MPDSSQNGHPSAKTPLLRPPLGERASRSLVADENVLGAEEASILDAEAATDEQMPSAQADHAAAPQEMVSLEKTPLFDARLDEESEDEAALAPTSGDGGEPPYIAYTGDEDDEDDRDPNTPRDKELGLIEHLAELRVRILYCVITVGMAMILTWAKCDEISAWLSRPFREALKGKGVPIVTDPAGFFTIYLQISLISAVILTMPFLLFQVWRFIEPALTNNERKFTLVLVPFSSLLFFIGAGMGYWLSPAFFNFFLEFQPVGVQANWDYFTSIVLLAKTMLIFGLAFQVPVITIFLNKAGLVSRNILIQYWRHAVVVIFTIVAIVTPTWDPFTMTACALPPCLLYLLSIWLVKWL